MIVSNGMTTLYLLNDGTVKGCGDNTYGLLCNGTNTSSNSLITIPNLNNVKKIYISSHNVFFILNDGTIKGAGNNISGQLGIADASIEYYTTPVTIPITGVKNIIAGSFDTMFLMNDGTVKGCGSNIYGELGLGNKVKQRSIVDIPSINNVKNIYSIGGYSFLFLLNDGTVKGCGQNTNGQLGIGNTTDQYSIVDIPISDVKDIFESAYNTFFLMNDGTVKGCGYNDQGQLGVGDRLQKNSIITIPNLNNVKNIMCYSSNYILFLLNDGTVKGCGDNNFGQLANNDYYTKKLFVIDIPINNVKNVYTTAYTSYFLLNDGTVKACGNNTLGELGINSTIQYTPILQDIPISNVKDIIQVSYGTVVFYLNDGTVKGCGHNSTGQLGIGNATAQKAIVTIPITNIKPYLPIEPIDPSVNDEIPIDGNYKYSYSLDDVPLSNGFETRLDAVYAAGNTDIVALYRQVTSNSTDKHVSIFKYNGNGVGQEYYSYRDQYDGFNGNWAVITEDGKKFISPRKGEIVILDENFQLDFTISGFLSGSSYGQSFDITPDGKYMVNGSTTTYPYIRVYKIDYINKTATVIPTASFSGSGSTLSDLDTRHIKFSKNSEYIFAMLYSKNTSTYTNIVFKRTNDTFTRINIEGSMCTHAYVAGFHGVISGDGRTLVTGGGQKTTNNLQIEELTLTIHRLINGVYKPIHTIKDKGSGVPVYIAGLSINYNGSMIFINMDNPGQNTLLSRKKNMLIYDFNTNLYKRDADFDAFALANGFISEPLSAWTSAYSFNKSGSKLFYINGFGTYSLGVLNISKEIDVEPTYNLTVNTIPADASFYIRVGAALSLQDKSKPIPLTPGEYYTNTIAKTDDYKDDVRTINITQDMTLNITLLRRPWVEFKVTPSDAVVMFNDAGTWVQGTKFRCLEGLTYEYTVSKTGFDTQIGTVVVGTQDIVRNIILVSNVRIDKEKRFPGTFKLLDITKPEYITEKGSVVIAGADKLVNIVLKAANVYKVTFVLTPSNAVVELLSKGSILTGTSFNLTPGSYTYQIKCDGYISKSGSVTVIGEAKTIKETLEEAIYQVSFTTSPTAAIVQVYYNNTWNSGKTHNLKKGSYQYRVTATDYTDKTGTIEVVNANVTTNVVLSSDGGVVTITNWTPTDAMSQMSPITEMFRLGKGLLPENNRLTYTLPKDKYQLKITSNQPQKYLPYYNKFELTGDKTINPVFRENAIDWSTMTPYLDDKLGLYLYDQPDRQSNRALINSQQIIFDDGYKLSRLLKSGSKFIYQKITDSSIINPNATSFRMISSAGNEIFTVECNTETFINRANSANISNIGKINNLNPIYITENGQYIIAIRKDGVTRKLSILTTNPFSTRPEITLNIAEYAWVEGKCSEDGSVVVLCVQDYDTKENINLLYKYNSGVYQQITLPTTVGYTNINTIGLIGSTHISFNSTEYTHSITPDEFFYDLFKINGNSLSRLTGNNSVYTINGTPMYRVNDINVVVSTPTGLICYPKAISGAGNIHEAYYSLLPSGTGYDIKNIGLDYSPDYYSIRYKSYGMPRYNKTKQSMYIALVSNLNSLAKDHPTVVNSGLLIFNKVHEINASQNLYADILSKDIYNNTNLSGDERIICISTDGNLVLTYNTGYAKLKQLKLYDLTNNSVSEYIP